MNSTIIEDCPRSVFTKPQKTRLLRITSILSFTLQTASCIWVPGIWRLMWKHCVGQSQLRCSRRSETMQDKEVTQLPQKHVNMVKASSFAKMYICLVLFYNSFRLFR